MLEPRPITATSGHRCGQVGLAVDRKHSAYVVRFYGVFSPRLTDTTAIMQSLYKGHHAAIAMLTKEEFVFNETM